MDQIHIWVLPILIILLFSTGNSEEDGAKEALVQFMEKLSPGNVQRDSSWGWNMSSDPCDEKWIGVTCDLRLKSVRKIVLDELNFTGVVDATSLCRTKSLVFLSLKGNSIAGLIPEDIANCRHLTHLFLSGNHFSGHLPVSFSKLSNLKRLDIADNNFSGELSDLSRISGLITFLAQNNEFGGVMPDFDFSNLLQFNVSNNNFSGPIPDVKGRFAADSFSGNPELCGKPLSNACPPPPPPSKKEPKRSSSYQFLIYSGYAILGLVIMLVFVLKIVSKNKAKKAKIDIVKNGIAVDTSNNKPSSASSDFKNGGNKSEYSITSVETGMASDSLIVLTRPVVKGLRFEDLLRAPAELLGRGKHGSLYKVMLNEGVILAVKRIKDWGITSEDFKKRMQKIEQVQHPNVLAPVAYYCSKQEKLLIYEYQQNGSLFKLLHGSQNDQVFDWASRLSVAAGVAEALAFMHEKLHEDEIAHGNLKSTNILFNKNMDMCISEYGLMVAENQDQSFISQTDSFKNKKQSGGRTYGTFKADIYGFGVILLELLTGKQVQNTGFELARWVHSVVSEEWTVEVFDKALMSEGASEERMVNLLQVALKCIKLNLNERPSINQVVAMINTIKEEEERSISSEPQSLM